MKPISTQKILPFLTWFSKYDRPTLRDDAMAGLTVGVVLIPQSMAYAMIAGLPPVYGLYSATVCTVIAALWGSLRQLSTGPVAITSLLVMTSLSPLAKPGTAEYISLACSLALLAGLFYLLLGFLRLGVLMNFISHSSVKGFTAAAAIIIATTQLPHVLGVAVGQRDNVVGTLMALAGELPRVNLATLGTGVAAYITIHLLRRLNPRLPAGLAGLFVGALGVAVFGLEKQGVATIDAISGGLPSFMLPSLSYKSLAALAGSAVVIGLVSFAETYSVSKAISAQTKQKPDVNQELIGQGLANLVGSFLQCYPASGSFSRTALNYSSGARTAMASLFSSGTVVITLLFLTPLLSFVPKAALAALVINAVIVLFRPHDLFSLYRKSRHDGIVALSVFSMGLLIKPDYALLFGIILSLVFYLWKTMHPKIIRVTRDETLGIFLEADRHDRPNCPQILLLQIDSEIYFGNAEYTVSHIIERVQKQNKFLKYLIIDFQSVTCIDITGIDELQGLLHELHGHQIETAFLNLNDEVQSQFSTSGLTTELDLDLIFTSKGSAIKSLFSRLDHEYCGRVCPLSLFNECTSVKMPST